MPVRTVASVQIGRIKGESINDDLIINIVPVKTVASVQIARIKEESNMIPQNYEENYCRIIQHQPSYPGHIGSLIRHPGTTHPISTQSWSSYLGTHHSTSSHPVSHVVPEPCRIARTWPYYMALSRRCHRCIDHKIDMKYDCERVNGQGDKATNHNPNDVIWKTNIGT